MLVLTRKIGEAIVIAEDIVVKVMSIDGDRVRLGIVAPRDVPVDRAEFRARRHAVACAEKVSGRSDTFF